MTEWYDKYRVFGFSTDQCTDCPVGSECKVFPPTGEKYCDPSCDIDNGGCDDDKICFLGLPRCFEEPCIGEVVCLTEGIIYMYVRSLNLAFKYLGDNHI